MCEPLFHLVEPLDGARVSLGGLAAAYIGGDHEPDFLADMIERENLIEKHEAGVGNSEFILGEVGQPLDLPHRVVGEKTNRASSKRWQAGQARGFVSAERRAQYLENVLFKMGDLAAFRNGDVPAARYDPLERGQTNEGVTPDLLAAFDGFEQKTFAFRPRGAQKGRNRGLEIGSENAANRDQGMFPGKGQKLFAGGLYGMA